MLLLTREGTILRLEKEHNRLIHAGLVPVREMATDFAVELPPEGLAGTLAGPAGITLTPGPRPGTAHMGREGRYLRVGRGPFPGFEGEAPGPAETLYLLEAETVAILRLLLQGSWRGAAGDEVPILIQPGPVLVVGTDRLDPLEARPERTDGDAIILRRPGLEELRLLPASAPAPAAPSEIPLRRASSEDAAPLVATELEFAAHRTARIDVPSEPEIMVPPFLSGRADREFLYRRGWQGRAPQQGPRHFTSQVVREQDKYVLLQRHAEGLIFDRQGRVSNEIGYLGNFAGRPPPGLGHEAGQYFIRADLLDQAPHLPGPHAVFYGGGYENYYHWLIDSMVPLSLMAPFLPPDVTLLLPGSLAAFRDKPIGRLDYIEVLDLFGFGDLRRIEEPGPVCHVDDIFWADRCTIADLPASALRAARDRVLARRPRLKAGAPGRRIFVRRAGTRALASFALIGRILERNGFETHLMEDLTATEQVDLFRQAEMVVAVHGAALANLIFCPPGTPVLELAPDCEYRPFFAEISSKLGLLHAVLPCPTQDGGFTGKLVVDPRRLTPILTALLPRAASAAAD